jgi:hypothetical protein
LTRPAHLSPCLLGPLCYAGGFSATMQQAHDPCVGGGFSHIQVISFTSPEIGSKVVSVACPPPFVG